MRYGRRTLRISAQGDPISSNEPTADEALLSAFLDGDIGAFETLVRRYEPDLMRFLSRLMGDNAAAEDVFQETFIQVHRSAHTFDLKRRFRPWLFTIAANKARDALRRRARRRTFDLSASPGGASAARGGSERTYTDLLEIDVPPPDADLDKEELDALVQRAVDAMPESLREILLLAYFQRMSYAQVADVLQIPLGTVKSRLHSAVASFAKQWKAVSGDFSPDA